MIAAYNEEKGIKEKIENSLKLDYPKDKFQIIVVSDGSTDGTDKIVKRFECEGVRLIRVEGRVGKTEARNCAIKKVDAEIVVFSDGTTHYTQNSIKELVDNFLDDKVGMVSGHLKYRDSSNSQVGAGQKLFWKYESLIKKAQTRLGTLTGAIGCITAFRKDLYTHLPANIIEDFTGPLFIIKQGYRVVFEENAICYEDTTQKSHSEWSMRVRVIRGGLTGLIYARTLLNPLRFPLVSFQLISHKVLRWCVPVFLISALLSNLILFYSNGSSPFIRFLFFSQLVCYIMALLGYLLERAGKHHKVLGIPLYFVIVNSASLVAIYKTLTSSLDATWETER